MLNTEEFIKRAKAIHGDRYDYSKVAYSGVNNKVEIICPVHGSFFQSKRLHIDRQNGCLQCSKSLPKRKEITSVEFLIRAKKIHGEKYTYSPYINYRSPISITCPRHGQFILSRASLHVTNKNGCPKCAHREDTEHFITKANKIHKNFYSYETARYETVGSMIEVGCPIHGLQKITPADHYRVGCWFCKRNRVQDIWLDEIGVPNSKENRQVRIKILDRLFIVDGKIDDTIFLFHGDYWHGNPKIYNATDINKRNGKTFGELHKETTDYEQKLSEGGFKVISIWEYDWLQGKKRWK